MRGDQRGHGGVHQDLAAVESPTWILFFHGNTKIAADYGALSALCTGCGAPFWVVDYRGYGRSTGMPTFSTLVEDAECVAADVARIIRICRDDDTRGREPGDVPC